MPARRRLIVNADDFGRSPGLNRGIIEAHERGIVTSASLMVRWPAALEAAEYARRRPALSLGIHIDLGEWAHRGGAWVPLYRVVPADDEAAVRDEVHRQLAAFHRLAGAAPTHIDSHQHVHLRDPARAILEELARDLTIPLRGCRGDRHYRGDFYGQTVEGRPLPWAISVDRLIAILEALPAGLTELSCHPGQADDLDTMYRSPRVREVAVLCNPRVRGAIVALGIELCSHSGIDRRERAC